MRILYVVPEPPSRIRVRSFGLIRALADLGHDVTVGTTVGSASDRRDVERLRGMGLEVIAEPLSRPRRLAGLAAAAVTGRPLQASYSWQPVLGGRLEGAVMQAEERGRPFDVAHVEHLRGARYGLALRSRLPVVWDSVDCITTLLAAAARHSRSLNGRLYSALDLERTRRYEGWLVWHFDSVVVTSDVDRQDLISVAQAVAHCRDGCLDGRENGTGGRASPRRESHDISMPKIAVVPNGVDLDYFMPADGPRDQNTILMTGKFSYHANVTAACYLVNEIMPLVWARCPEARVVLAGAQPSREVRSLARRHPKRVAVTGFLEDLRPYLQSATVAVAPLVYAAGVQNKILEAMACGTPVVATPEAVRGLARAPACSLCVADEPHSFVEAIARLFGDTCHGLSATVAARAYIERHRLWCASAALVERAYSRAARLTCSARST